MYLCTILFLPFFVRRAFEFDVVCLCLSLRLPCVCVCHLSIFNIFFLIKCVFVFVFDVCLMSARTDRAFVFVLMCEFLFAISCNCLFNCLRLAAVSFTLP